jgi:predicted phosphodiesterase
VFVRGNGDRAVVEFTRGGRALERPRDGWMCEQHSPAAVDFLAAFPFTAIVEVRGLGAVRFCHGSPRSDTELLTPGTPADRLAQVAAVIAERVLVSGHTHLQFDRSAAGLRSVNPGSVGLPYHGGAPGTAYWALLGPDVEGRQTRYPVEEEVRRCVDAGDPSAEVITELLLTPPTVEEVIRHAEAAEFSD